MGGRWDISCYLPAPADLAWLPDDTPVGNLLGQDLLSGICSLAAHDDNLDGAENWENQFITGIFC